MSPLSARSRARPSAVLETAGARLERIATHAGSPRADRGPRTAARRDRGGGWLSRADDQRALEYLRWFGSQGQVMDLATRERLWRTWGMCAEHSLTWLAVEHSLEAGWMHGPAVVYEDLIERAVWAVRPRWIRFPPTAGLLRTSHSCIVCEKAGRPDGALRDGPRAPLRRDALRHLTSGAAGSFARESVCGTCAGTGSALRCRPHLLADLERDGHLDLAPQRAFLSDVLGRLARYARSFGFDSRGSESADDRAALVAAVGWCNGWQALLETLAEAAPDGFAADGSALRSGRSQPGTNG